MKYMFYAILSIISLCGCFSLKRTQLIQGNLNDAILYAIKDFASKKDKIFKAHKIFSVLATDTGGYFRVNITGALNKISLITEDSIFYSYRAFPTAFIIEKNKLFFWDNDSKAVSNSIVRTLYQYNFVDTAIIGKYFYIPEHINDDAQKSMNYYFCKDDLSNYKRKVSSAWGRYKPPRLKCKKR
jgi:hypothetical protein